MKKLKYSGLIPINVLRLRVQTSFSFKVWAFESDDPDLRRLALGGPNITANLYCICLSEHETCAYADAVQMCGHI